MQVDNIYTNEIDTKIITKFVKQNLLSQSDRICCWLVSSIRLHFTGRQPLQAIRIAQKLS